MRQPAKAPRGEEHYNARLTEADVKAIRERRKRPSPGPPSWVDKGTANF